MPSTIDDAWVADMERRLRNIGRPPTRLSAEDEAWFRDARDRFDWIRDKLPTRRDPDDVLARIRRQAEERHRDAYCQQLLGFGMAAADVANAPPTDLPWLPVAHTRPFAYCICACPGHPAVRSPSFWGPR